MRTRLAVAAAILTTMAALSGPAALAVDGVDLPGHDYAGFEAPSALACRNTCGGESRCQAYTWVKPGVQSPGGRCWLKHTLPAIVRSGCCDSGPRHFIERTDLRAEDRTNRPGLDYRSFETDSWRTCEAACGEDGLCASWTHVRRGVQGPSGRCWLKNRVARPVPDANAVSGVKFRPASVRID